MMNTLWNDIKYGLRQLRKNPGFTVVAILTLALGIGGVTSILSVFNGMFLHLLPYEQADRLVVFDTRVPGIDRPITSTAAAFYEQWRTETDSFDGLAAYYPHSSYDSYSGWKDTEDNFKDLIGFHITPNFFMVLGVEPILGRTFDESENLFKENHLVIISHHVWRERFGADPNVLEQSVRLDGRQCRIVGVVGPNIRFLPSTVASLMGTFSINDSVAYWIPMPKKFHKIEEIDCSFDVVGRFKPGVTRTTAQAQMDVLNQRLFAEHLAPMGIKSFSVTITPLRSYLLGSVSSSLWLLLAAACFVLLIACANVANLLLIHNMGRVQEMAVCSALGGTRLHWLRQRLMDSSLIALSGGLLGIILAYWGTKLLLALAPADLPGLDQVHLNISVLGVTLCISLICGLTVGLLPTLRFTRINIQDLLKGMSRSCGAFGVKERRTLGSLGMVEVALALVLLLGATLTLRSFWSVLQIEIGLNTDHILCANLMGHNLKQDHQTILQCLQDIPGVEALASTTALPLSDQESDFTTVHPVVWDDSRKDQLSEASLRTVSLDYFNVMGIRLLQGRTFNRHDSPESDRVVVINQKLAQRFWPQGDFLGQHIKFGDIQMVMGSELNEGVREATYRIVGVIRDIRYKGPESPAPFEVYLPLAQALRNHESMGLVLRCRSISSSTIEAIEHEIESVGPKSHVTGFTTMQDFLNQRTSVRRFVMTLLLTFAGVALSLAVIGIYSVTACTVSARMREVGIRKAFGADPIQVLKLILKQGMTWVFGGLGLGLLLALMLRKVIASQLFETSTLDPLTLVVGILVILLASLTACLLPASRAAKVDPMGVLRCE